MDEPTTPPTVGNVVGENLRRLRQARRLTQDKAAELLVRHGLNWKRTHVSDLESGRRETVDAGTLVALAAAWEVPIPQLLAGDGDVLLTPRADYAESRVTATRQHLRQWYSGEEPEGGTTVGGPQAVRAGMDYESFKGRSIPVEADKALAKRLNTDVQKIVDAAEDLWGASLTEERDRRVAALGDLPPAERQAKQGHITRNLIGVLTRWIAGGPEMGNG